MEKGNGIDMMEVLSTNITSPLGMTTEENHQALKAGNSLLARYERWKGIPEPFTASLMTESQMQKIGIEGFTRFESMVIHSVKEALSHTDIDIRSPHTLFILSTTKADIAELGATQEKDGMYLAPGAAAKKIADHIGFANDPVMVCNACISGVTAQHLAHRLMAAGHYDHAVVCGADCQSPFIVSGFMSFKSLSPFECRPFDIERLGLNLGEAAATIVFGRPEGNDRDRWQLCAGDLDNDAYHVSAPSPDGDGSYRAIMNTIEGWDTEKLAMVNVHGTATMFNDQMESKAIERAGLSSVPLLALKGYYGHTLGASGVLECIVSMRALDEGIILPTRGFTEIGVSGKVSISESSLQTDKRSFVKVISGFGGCNGALLFSKGEPHVARTGKTEIKTGHSLRMSADSLTVNEEKIGTSAKGKAMLTELYKKHIGDWPKFYKMDMFSRLAFTAAELLIQKETKEEQAEIHDIILFNRSSSVIADRNHLATLGDEENFFPSPSIFLYTLPNVVTGEIALKHSYTGETSLYILNDRNEALITQIIQASMATSRSRRLITGWVDCQDENNFEADLKILTK